MDISVNIHLEGKEFFHNIKGLNKVTFPDTYYIQIGSNEYHHVTYFVTLDQARQIIRGLAGQLRGIERGLEK